MQTTTFHGMEKSLLTKERKLGSEAPAISLKMNSGEEKVIGMMATKVQVIITLPFVDALSDALLQSIGAFAEKSFIYLICPTPLTKAYDAHFSSQDFEVVAKKFGVFIDDTMCAKSIFIIDKEGVVVYKEITKALEDEFSLELFKSALDDAIAFKRKGHVHENWMGA